MANVRIPQLPVAISLDGTEQLEIVQSDPLVGFVSRRTTAQDIAGLVNFFVFPGTVLIVTDGTVIDVAANVRTVILNKSVASATTLQFPTVTTRGSMPIQISDWGGNAGDITCLPFSGQLIMNDFSAVLISNGAGFGPAAFATFWPNITLNGWYSA